MIPSRLPAAQQPQTSKDCWLLIDIGNTHTVAGVFPAKAQRPQPIQQVRFRTDAQATGDEYRSSLQQLFLSTGMDLEARICRIIASSVVPALDATLQEAFGKTVPITLISAATPRDFALDLPHPEQLGADRLANVAGALMLAPPPLLIVDAGTATTFCLIDERPAYIGGAITPGLEISWKALQGRAAKLFSVPLDRPAHSLGRTTETQLQSGVLLGYEALIEGMTDRLLCDAGQAFAKKATLFATGGCLHWLKLSSRFRHEPDLTLIGLLRYAQLTQDTQS